MSIYGLDRRRIGADKCLAERPRWSCFLFALSVDACRRQASACKYWGWWVRSELAAGLRWSCEPTF